MNAALHPLKSKVSFPAAEYCVDYRAGHGRSNPQRHNQNRRDEQAVKIRMKDRIADTSANRQSNDQYRHNPAHFSTSSILDTATKKFQGIAKHSLYACPPQKPHDHTAKSPLIRPLLRKHQALGAPSLAPRLPVRASSRNRQARH